MSDNKNNNPLFSLTVSEFLSHFSGELTSMVEAAVERKMAKREKEEDNSVTMDVNEAARLLKLGRQTIYQNISKIPHRKIFGRLVFLRKELLDFIDNNGNTNVRNKGDP